jgi:diaminopimelate decarboxylase
MIHTNHQNSYLRPRWGFASVQEGALHVENTPVESIAQRFGTPFYLLVESDIRTRLRRFTKAFPYSKFKPQYAVKCNSNIEILKIIREEGFEADASSIGEIILSLLAGFAPHQITFTNLCKTEQDIIFAAQIGVKAITLDSMEEVEKAIKAAKSSDSGINIFIRVNPKIKLDEYSTTKHQYGIPIDRAKEAIDAASAAENVNIIGVHWHGAYVPSPKVYHMALRKILPIIKYAIAKGNKVEYLDLGGGFPVEYGDAKIFTPEEVGSTLVPELEDLTDELGLPRMTLIFEPGKFIVANSGIGVTRVVSVKDLGERKLAIVDGSTYAMLPDPLTWECYYHILPVNKMETEPSETYDIHGSTCDYLDRIGKDRKLPALNEGDLLAVMDTGAYSNVLASNFNTLKRPPMILVKEDSTLQVIRRRDRYSEMFAAETDLVKGESNLMLKNICNEIRRAATTREKNNGGRTITKEVIYRD